MSLALLSRKSEAARPASKAKAAPTGLRIGEPNDSFEREADRAADEVTAGGSAKREWSLSKISTGTPLQRKGARAVDRANAIAARRNGSLSGNPKPRRRPEPAWGQDFDRVPANAGMQGRSSSLPLAARAGVESSGQALDARTREDMESRFGFDFSQVRIHAGAQAAESALARRVRLHTRPAATSYSDPEDTSLTR